MSQFFQWISKYRREYDRFAGLADLSPAQRKEAMRRTMQEFSDSTPRDNQNGNAVILNGSRYAVMPLNFLRADYDQLKGVFINKVTDGQGGIVPLNIYDFFGRYEDFINFSGYLDPLNSPLGSTAFKPGYDASIPEPKLPTTTTDRGRIALDLGAIQDSNSEVQIFYEALHEIEDDGILVTLNVLPIDGDTLRIDILDNSNTSIANKTYTFKDTLDAVDQIEIQSDIYQMAEMISDQIMIDNLAEAAPDYQKSTSSVLIRPVSVSAYNKIACTVDGTRLVKSRLPGKKTLAFNDEYPVFELLLSHVHEQKERQAIEYNESFRIIKIHTDAKIYHRKNYEKITIVAR